MAAALVGLAAAALLADAAIGGWDTASGTLPLVLVALAAIVLGRPGGPGGPTAAFLITGTRSAGGGAETASVAAPTPRAGPGG